MSSLDVVAVGARGGTGANGYSPGEGASVEDTGVSVSGGESLSVVVGGVGGDGTAGGGGTPGGGGAGGDASVDDEGGGGGGGYSGVLDQSATPLVIAGGGGGSGGIGDGSGGNGGTPDGGQGFYGDDGSGDFVAGGGGGVTSAGTSCENSGAGGPGGDGSGGGASGGYLSGGNGGAAANAGDGGGGGGGGGYCGGGGGGGDYDAASGGGGSSYSADPDWTTESVSSSAASVTINFTPPPQVVSAASLSGTPADGQTLHLDFEFSSTAGPLMHAYQWERCSDQAMTQSCVTVGNNSRNYTLSYRDVGEYVTGEVTATDANGQSTSSTSPVDGPIAAPSAPSVVSDAALTGTAQDGQVLHASGFQFSSPDPLGYSYQWERCSDQAMTVNCSNVGTGRSYYRLSSADIGDYVAVTVTATDREGQTGSSTSGADGPVGDPPAPVNKTAPSITGTTQQGQVLQAHKGVWKSPDTLAYRYQWLRCASDGTRCFPIRYASHNTYTLTSADAGHQIALRVTATDQEGQSTSETSQPVGPIS